MNYQHGLARIFKTIGLALTLGVAMSACSEASWKEEVLLHDGSKIIATRSQTRGGGGEVGQSPIKEHSVTFTVPGTTQPITWKDEFSEDVRHSNFDLLALHILDGRAYIVTTAYGSSSYKKWGSPNPPYILFKYDGKTWPRIALSDFPTEFIKLNIVINSSAHEKKLIEETQRIGFVSFATVNDLNSSLTQEEYKSIVRMPLAIWKPRPTNMGPKAPTASDLRTDTSSQSK